MKEYYGEDIKSLIGETMGVDNWSGAKEAEIKKQLKEADVKANKVREMKA